MFFPTRRVESGCASVQVWSEYNMLLCPPETLSSSGTNTAVGICARENGRQLVPVHVPALGGGCLYRRREIYSCTRQPREERSKPELGRILYRVVGQLYTKVELAQQTKMEAAWSLEK